jgi:hypothetical protein
MFCFFKIVWIVEFTTTNSKALIIFCFFQNRSDRRIYDNKFKRTDNFLFFQNRLDRRIYDTNSRHTPAFFLPFFVFQITVTILSMLKSFLLFVTVAMLPRYQSPVNCRNRNAEGNFNPLNTQLNPICHLLALLVAHRIFYVSRIRIKHKVNYRFVVLFEAWNLCKAKKATPLQAWTGPEGSGRLKLPDFTTIGT